jgi:hypothetical protein
LDRNSMEVHWRKQWKAREGERGRGRSEGTDGRGQKPREE